MHLTSGLNVCVAIADANINRLADFNVGHHATQSGIHSFDIIVNSVAIGIDKFGDDGCGLVEGAIEGGVDTFTGKVTHLSGNY